MKLNCNYTNNHNHDNLSAIKALSQILFIQLKSSEKQQLSKIIRIKKCINNSNGKISITEVALTSLD